MKNILTIIALLVTTVCFSQSPAKRGYKENRGKYQFSGIVWVDSLYGNFPTTSSDSISLLIQDRDTKKTHVIENAIVSGFWTPTLTNTTNVTASTSGEFKFTKIAGTTDLYTFSGEVEIDPTTTATLTVLTLTLPVTTAVSATRDVSGTASDDLGTSCRVAGNTSSGLMEIRFTPVDVTNRKFSVVGQFKYIAP